MKTICLNMIVRNEAKVIERCLASVKKIVDYWVIIDTGSTDGTQAIILDVLKDIPGELHERPWVDFAHNRNEALAIAKKKADYLLFIDADERLIFSDLFQIPPLEKDYYFVNVQETSGVDYHRELLIRSSLNWTWKGAVHEAILCPEAKTCEILRGVRNLSATEEGHRWQDPNKYLKDAEALEKDLKKNPLDSRTVFYLAMSYSNAGQYDNALKYFQMRASMGGIEEEVFYSLLMAAISEKCLGIEPERFLNSFAKAYLYRPTRAEPLFWMANYYIASANPLLGYLLSKEGLSIPLPKDILFVQRAIYDTQLLLQYADCAFALGKYEETSEAYEKLLAKENLAPEIKSQINHNMNLLNHVRYIYRM